MGFNGDRASDLLTVRRAARAAARRLAAHGIDEPRREAWLLLGIATGRTRADLLAGSEDPLGQAQAQRFADLLQRRAGREPLAYIAGEKEFWSLPFQVGPPVLIPRPETETLVEAALAGIPDRGAPSRILDLGTGSGCILLALLHELPHATGLGVDASEAALGLASANARRLGLAARARFCCADWGSGIRGTYDLIVSNPPYVRARDWAELAPEIRAHEPAAALLAGRDGLDAYRALAPDLARLLAPGGRAWLEAGQGQAGEVAGIMRAHGLKVADVREDLAGIARCVSLVPDP